MHQVVLFLLSILEHQLYQGDQILPFVQLCLAVLRVLVILVVLDLLLARGNLSHRLIHQDQVVLVVLEALENLLDQVVQEDQMFLDLPIVINLK